MAERQEDEKLLELRNNGAKIYSISKANTVENCMHEVYQKYIKKNQGESGVYGLLGTKIHDTLELIMNEKATEEDLIPALESELETLDMVGIDFPKDRNGGSSIRDSWITSMNHFCSTFKKPIGEFETEVPFLFCFNEEKQRYLMGYIDLIKHNQDGTLSIYDWKTSSEFKDKDLVHHGRQLAVYVAAKQKEGFEIKNVAWIMLKYCTVKYFGRKTSLSKQDTQIIKNINRKDITKTLKSDMISKLSALGYEDLEIDIIIDEALKTNEIPSIIKDQYEIKPYVRQYEITPEIINEAIDYVSTQADIFEAFEENPDCEEHRDFYDEKGRDDTFYCHSLCSYRNSCVHIKRFDGETPKTNDDDLF